jgi:hypothetical protein
MANADCVTRAIDYNSQIGLASDVMTEGETLQTLANLRDAVVEAAKAEGRIDPAAASTEFLLRVRTLYACCLLTRLYVMLCVPSCGGLLSYLRC